MKLNLIKQVIKRQFFIGKDRPENIDKPTRSLENSDEYPLNK